ncbi:hypothetical protein [Nocardioides gilvus]|uniref:hypothetical protein n=1 Tax=Nocardioides gilvus TaxID=1735589 RepID=UPI0013A5335C|nr:hypothetical protein [Nocardioides gilvus]
MRGQRGLLIRGWGAAGSAVLLTGLLAGCASEDDARVSRAAAETPAATAELAMAPAAVTPGLVAPEWFPLALPMPEGASVTAVGTLTCTVNFLVPTSDAQVEGGAVGSRARANGLQVELVSSVTSAEPVNEPVNEFGAFEEEAPVAPVITHVEVLRLKNAADGAAVTPVDATLTLTSRGDGVVTGEYALAEDTCAR